MVGLDIARGLAILGMFVAHAIPRGGGELLVDGRSSILFASLAGVSVGIMTGSARPLERGRRADRVVGIILRALILLVLGFMLNILNSEVAVILDYYGVMFLLIAPVLFAPRWTLGLGAAVLLVGAPMLAAVLNGAGPTMQPLAALVRGYFLTGDYPALIFLPFLLVGLIAARSDLGRAKTQFWMIAGGVLAAVLGYGAAYVLPGLTARAHSGSTAEILGSGGFALAVIGTLLWLTARERGRVGQVLRALLWPIGATGSMALTVYTLQILLLAVAVGVRDNFHTIDYPGWPLLLGMTFGSLVFVSLWRRFLGKGPLERGLAFATREPVSRAKARARARSHDAAPEPKIQNR
ncbi:DUF418 domain-containing protein [Cryobacterium sp. Sr8]|nr:DUF418 domain-containing protein [Cryobacterium sp. Sr8]